MQQTPVQKFENLIAKKKLDYRLNKKAKNLGNRVIAITAPPGAGKTSCIEALFLMNFYLNEIFEKYGLSHPKFVFAPGTTTRLIRKGEKHGFDFYFLNDKQYLDQLKNKDFVLSFISDPYLYAVDGKDIERKLLLSDNYTVFIYNLNAFQVPRLKDSFSKKPKVLFINAPSVKELEDRKFKRGGLSEEEIEFRKKTMLAEMKQGQSIADKRFINRDFIKTAQDMTSHILKDVIFKNARIKPAVQRKIMLDLKKAVKGNQKDILSIIK